jgi:hypothetical protein
MLDFVSKFHRECELRIVDNGWRVGDLLERRFRAASIQVIAGTLFALQQIRRSRKQNSARRLVDRPRRRLVRRNRSGLSAMMMTLASLRLNRWEE